MMKNKSNQGFTLFEIAISLALVTFGVVSVLMLLPSGMKAQHYARHRIHACVWMQALSSYFVEPGQNHLNLTVERKTPTGNHYMRRGLHDLETVSEVAGMGLCPLPLDIARRLDSDNDEIRRILAAGGRLYYSTPGSSSLDPDKMAARENGSGPPQTLILGILGSPQLNALPNHPCMAWPYWDNHPMAPAKWELDNWAINSAEHNAASSERPWQCYQQFKALYDVFNSNLYPKGGMDFATYIEYRKKAGELVTALNMPLETSDYAGRGPVPAKPQPYPTNGENWQSMPADSLDPRPEYVWAVSHLAHAAALATAQFSDGEHAPEADDITYTKKTYEACVAWVQRSTAANPYNWGVARHLSSATAWDFPLIQQDMFPTSLLPSVSESIPGKSGFVNNDVAYRLVSPIPVTNYGQARGHHSKKFLVNEDPINYQSPTIPSTSNYYTIKNNWGDPNHYVITRRFDPSERMRQVIFWSVDWINYVDFESAPAPEHDATMCFEDTLGDLVNSDMWGNHIAEKKLYWVDEDRAKRVVDGRTGSQGGRDELDTQKYKAGKFMGMWGADRNNSQAFEVGPVPKSVRMYATQIARFPIYDRILVSDGRF